MKTALVCAAVAVVMAQAPAYGAETARAAAPAPAIAISTQNIPAAYAVLGDVRVVVHQTEIFPAVSTRRECLPTIRSIKAVSEIPAAKPQLSGIDGFASFF